MLYENLVALVVEDLLPTLQLIPPPSAIINKYSVDSINKMILQNTDLSRVTTGWEYTQNTDLSQHSRVLTVNLELLVTIDETK